MNLIGPRLPSSSGAMAAPSRVFFSIARQCSGMSGRLQASGAGDRSSVLVSPGTLKTVTVMALRHFGAAGEPLGVGPALHHRLGIGVAGLSAFSSTSWKTSNISSVFFSASAAIGADLGVVEQLDQRLDVVAAEHGAQQFGGLGAGDQRATFASPCATAARKLALTLAASSTPGRHAVGDQVDQEGFLARRRGLQQLDQLGGLLGVDSGSGGMPSAARSATCWR